MAEDKLKLKLLGEAAREVGVLVGVFFPLEAHFNEKFRWTSGWKYVLVIEIVVFGVFSWGMRLAGKAEDNSR